MDAPAPSTDNGESDMDSEVGGSVSDDKGFAADIGIWIEDNALVEDAERRLDRGESFSTIAASL